MKKANILLTVSAFVFCLQAQAGLLFNYSQLALKDLDQMNALVTDKVKEARKSSSGKAVPLKEALQAVYSRPNDDDMIEKVVAPLRSNLDELESWEKTLSQLTDEAINALKNPKAFKPVVQMTYVIFLENLLAEVKPYIKTSGFERELVERIQKSNIQVTKEAANERKLRTMKATISPSEIAAKVLDSADQKVQANPEASSSSSPESLEKGK